MIYFNIPVVIHFETVMRRFILLTSVFILYCLSGCSQNDHMDGRGRIPIDAGRWYQLNNTSKSLAALFNGNKYDKLSTTDGSLLKNYDAYYPLMDNEQMTIDRIRFFDWEGTNENHPMTIYAILSDWKKIPIAVFTGSKYNEWVGPDPKKPRTYDLEKPVSGIRCLVINSWGDFPGEIEFYGTYVAPKAVSKANIKPVPLRNYFGVNAFEWDFEAPNNPMQPDPMRLAAIKNFTGVRHYMDWEKLESHKGSYAFAPTYNGGWNYDAIYEWCKAQGIEVLACLKTIPGWMQQSYPNDERDNENIPASYGKDPADPGSYLEQAKVAFQYAARYGNNTGVENSLLTLRPDNNVRTGLGLVGYIECDNERDKWWKGRKAYQTGREYAANLSAFYDGNKNTMGRGVGVKNADPAMKVVMAGLARPTTDYVRGMIDWCKEHRGYKQDGSVNCPWDVINYHFYANDASADPSAKQTTGIAPELSKADSFANEFVQMAHVYAGDMPVWVTETGYDVHHNSPQRASALNGRSAMDMQADWVLRTSLLYARTGVQKVFFYELYDDNSDNGERYASSGLVNRNGMNRPAADFLRQTNKLFGGYTYRQTINRNPIVDKYVSGDRQMYMLVVPGQSGRTANFRLDMVGADSVYIYKPKAGNVNMEEVRQKTNRGKIDITVTETPVFVTSFKSS
jgi:endoglucanase